MENGFTRIPNGLIKGRKLTCYEKLVCIVLVAYRMDKDSCFPSRQTLAAETGFDVKTVDKAIKGLKEKHFIKRIEREGRKNIYFLSDILKINEKKSF